MGVSMKMISSKAGTRLAKAKHQLDQIEQDIHCCDERDAMLMHNRDLARRIFHRQAAAVADELVAQRFHLMEGD